MNLQIRDPRARSGGALEADLARDAEHRPLAERVAEITADLKAISRPGGRDLAKPEIDALWGHD
jgi:hypothetical protein